MKRTPLSIVTQLERIAATGKVLTEIEAAELMGWSVKTLQKRRWQGKRPAFLKIGASVRYDPAELIDFIEGARRRSTTDPDRTAAA